MRHLVQYTWPGNVRELRNAIERAVVLANGPSLTVEDLPPEIARGTSAPSAAPEGDSLEVPYLQDFKEARREFERIYIERRLAETGGNVTRAAELLDMHRQSLQHKLRELGIKKRYAIEP
jgi:two-component system response regulator AtoC